MAITGLRFLKNFASLDPTFMWDNVPQFAVIAGINGAGKTKLLEAVNQACANYPNKWDVLSITSNVDLRETLKYVSINHGFGTLYSQPANNQPHSGTTQHIEKRRFDVVQWLRAENNVDPQRNTLLLEIAQRAGKEIDIATMSIEEIALYLPPNAVLFFENAFNNNYISEVCKAYKEKIDHVKVSTYDTRRLNLDEIYAEIGFRPPWEVINEMFHRYPSFNYSLNAPTTGMEYIPTFQDNANQSNDQIQFGELSSGEKIIVSLILWAYNHKLGSKNKVFLLDEFDARLNPSMSRMFIEVIKEKIVIEFGIQVIMTTHSPSTVAHVDDDDLFWMERGKQIRKSSRKEIIPILSDGIMTYQEASGLLEAVISSDNTAILFTEGVSDAIHIRTAISKLDYHGNIDVIPCGDENGGGADKLKQFLIGCPAKLFERKVIIGLFDYDREGLDKMRYFERYLDINYAFVSKSNSNVFAILIQPPDRYFEKYKNCPIEYLYSREILEQTNMLGEKRQISEINALDSTNPMNLDDYAKRLETWFYKISEGRKKAFSDLTPGFHSREFANFKPTLDLLSLIIKAEVTANLATPRLLK